MEEEDEDEFADEEWEEEDAEYSETASPISDYQLGVPHSGKILLRRKSITDLVIVSPQIKTSAKTASRRS